MSNEPNKTNANINSAIGNIKEVVGSTTGYTDLERAGKEQRTQADAEYKAAQAKGVVDGTVDQVQGKFDHVVGAVTGDSTRETSGQVQEKLGKAQREANS